MLVSPISVHLLCRRLNLSVAELLQQKAKAEVAIHTWVLNHSEPRSPSQNTPLKLAEQEPQPMDAQATRDRSVPDWKRLRPRSGKPWSDEEDFALLQGFDAGMSAEEIAERRQRGVYAIEVRLWKLGRKFSLEGRAEAVPCSSQQDKA